MGFDVDVTLVRGHRRIAAAFRSGEGATVLVGPSGTGKTSVLLAIAGLLRPVSGHVRVGGCALFDAATNIDVPPERRRAGVVFQESRLFPHRSVRGNLRYGAPDDRALAATAAMLDLAGLLDRRPRTLSGGEARRVAIGRALLRDPAFLLLDEPTVSLDGARREEVMHAVERLRDTTRVPILMVTHDRAEAERLAADNGRVVELSA